LTGRASTATLAREEAIMRRALRACLVSLAWCLGGCAVAVPAGEPVYGPPVAVVEPPAEVFVWFPWPHYDVEHRYVIENERVVIHDRHYTPFYDRTHPYVRNDRGQHRGWYKHRD
jgi:hypothetical protein